MPKGRPNKKYTGKFKQMVVETMEKEGLSYRETAKIYEITDNKQVAKWERIYLEEGAEGLAQLGQVPSPSDILMGLLKQ